MNRKVRYEHEDNRYILIFYFYFFLSSSSPSSFLSLTEDKIQYCTPSFLGGRHFVLPGWVWKRSYFLVSVSSITEQEILVIWVQRVGFLSSLGKEIRGLGDRVKLDLSLASGRLQSASWQQEDRDPGLITITSSSCCWLVTVVCIMYFGVTWKMKLQFVACGMYNDLFIYLFLKFVCLFFCVCVGSTTQLNVRWDHCWCLRAVLFWNFRKSSMENHLLLEVGACTNRPSKQYVQLPFETHSTWILI